MAKQKGIWPGNSKTSVADDNRVISGTCGKACRARRKARAKAFKKLWRHG